MNGTEAYRRLHPKTTYDSCRSSAADVLAKPNIKAAISARLDQMAMPKNEILSRLSGMARASTFKFIRITKEGFCYFDFSDPEAEQYFYLIKKIKTKRTRRLEGKGKHAEPWEDEWVEVELHDARAALETLGRYQQLDKQSDDSGNGDYSKYFTIPAELFASSFLDSHRAVVSGKYDEFLEYGGRGSTKSTFVGYEIIALIKNNPTMHALAMRQVADTLRNSVYAQLEWCINQLGLSHEFKLNVSPMVITYLPTGQKIYFAGADDPSNLKSIKPQFGYIGILWIEETDQLHGAEAVRTIEQSIRGGEKIYKFKTWNTPRTANNWINKYLKIPKEKQWRHLSTYLDVPVEWLGQPWIDDAEHLKAVNPKAYDHEYMGLANSSGGMVFENVKQRKITDEEIKTFNQLLRGADWGWFPDPFSFGLCYYNPAKLQLFIFGEHRANKTSNRKIYDQLVEKNLIGPKDLLIADNSEPKSIADFRAYGCNIIGAEKGPSSVDYSMKWMQSLAEIIIDPERAPHHAEEFSNYELEKDKEGEFISAYPDKNNHAIDDTRYATNLTWRRRGQ